MRWQDILGVTETTKYPETFRKGKGVIKPDERLIKEVKDLMEKDPKITRNRLCKTLKVSLPRLLELESQGLVKIPAKVSRSRFHLYAAKAKKHPWR